jgi:hypothetical protein
MSDNESDTYSEDEEINTNNEFHVKIDTSTVISIYYTYLKDLTKMLIRPEYQRNLCWSPNKMCMFIDSIMKNFIIPNYVIYKLSPDEKKENKHFYECIDGQHRLESLRLFINCEKYPGTNKYLYWKKDGIKVFYEKLPLNIKSSNKRVMLSEEKDKFDSFSMSLHTIEPKSKKGIEFKIKREIFNRLQNGEKVSSYEKFKNTSNPIIDNIRTNQYILKLREMKLKDKIIFDRNIKQEDEFNIYLLIRTYLIIDKISLLNINYLNFNIKRYIEANDGKGAPSVQLKTDIDVLSEKVIEIITWLNVNIKEPVILEIIYIYICIYAKYGLIELSNLLKIFTNRTKFDKYNKLTTYKSSHEKVTSSNIINDIYTEIIDKFLNK